MNNVWRYLHRQMRSAYANLAAMGLRSLLAMLGIMVGTGSVVAMVSGGQLATQAALERFRSLGTDIMAVSLAETPNYAKEKLIFSLDQAMHIKSLSPQILLLAAYTVTYAPTIYQGTAINPPVIATTQDLANVAHLDILYGRFISDYDNYEPFCVIGNQIASHLHLDNPAAIGERIRIGNNTFTIVGVAGVWPENNFFSDDLNTSIIIPFNTLRLLDQSPDVSNVIMRLDEHANINLIETKISNYFKDEVPYKIATVHSSKTLIKRMLEQRAIFSLLLGLIGSVSLFVGGIGVMNIMLVSVLERRREIGIRIALGATHQEIEWMFISEAVILSISGGLAGTIMGIACSYIVARIANWPFTLFFWPPIIGFAVSFITGVFFGYYPAHQASKLNPIETLREG